MPARRASNPAEVPGSEPVVVGRITSPYGIKGWVRIASYTAPPANLLSYAPWLVRSSEGWQQIVVDATREHGNHFVAHVTGCDDRDQAQRLAGQDIAVPAEALPATDVDEYYWKDLLGLEVVGKNGRRLGRVTRMIETGANDVMVVQGDDGEHLIAFRKEFVLDVDLERGSVEVDWDPSWEAS